MYYDKKKKCMKKKYSKEFIILRALFTAHCRGVKSGRTIRRRTFKNPQNVSDDYRYRKYTRIVSAATTAYDAGGNAVKLSIVGDVGIIVVDSVQYGTDARVARDGRTDGQTNGDRHARQTTRANRARGSTSAIAAH
jgi:hypothetical protein